MEKIRLNDGNCIPAIGFGVFRIPPDGSTYRAVREALDAGYPAHRHRGRVLNEREVGRAVREERDTARGHLRHQQAVAAGLRRGGERAGRCRLISWGSTISTCTCCTSPYRRRCRRVARAGSRPKKPGRIRSIGVSNMTPKIWNAFVPHFDTVPAVNQVECNPYFQQRALRAITDAAGTVLEAWGPLGQGSGKLLSDPVLTQIAARHGKNVGQTILRFELQDGIVVLPKSTNPGRIRGNLDVFDFALDEEEMRATARSTRDAARTILTCRAWATICCPPSTCTRTTEKRRKTMEYLTLYNGVGIPQLGFGVF